MIPFSEDVKRWSELEYHESGGYEEIGLRIDD